MVKTAISTNNKEPHSIGILGGTFDPIHHGHLHYGQQIAEQLELEQVSLLPAHIPPHKSGTHANAEQRLEMVKLACQQNPLFCVDDRELHRDEHSYTINTLKQIKAEQPDTILYFFIGMDSLANLSSWYQWQELLTLCHLIVTDRPGYQVPEPGSALGDYIENHLTSDLGRLRQDACGYIYLAHTDNLEISSSAIRERLASRQNCQYLLPESILGYIFKHKLYV
jgi:nicotinate-nucleotide adenylyltransferase